MRENILSNILWRFAERCGAQGVTFVVAVALARLLEPEVYGTVALVTVLTSIMSVFIDSGFGNALIQKKDADDLDFSTVFFFNVAAGVMMYLAVFALAPVIAAFYRNATLIPVIRVLAITLVIAGVKNVQQAYVSRTMQFRRFFYATLGGTIGAAIVGISMAYMGFGVWALVCQSLLNATVDTIILWITVKWHPKWMFSFERLKGLYSFGWKLFVSGLLETVYKNLRQLIIGKLYTTTDLAQYNRGQTLPEMIVSNVNSSIDSVLFPTMSMVQDDIIQVKAMLRRSMKISTYIMAPMMMGLAFVGEPVVRLLLTEKWLPCVPFMCISCVTYMFYPVHTANLNAIKAMGRSDLFLKLEISKKVVGLIVLVATMWFGVMAMAYSLLFTSLASQIINSWPNKKLLNYGYLEQLKDIMPSILVAVVMGCCIYPIQWLGFSDVVALILQVLMGAVIYVGLSVLLKFDSFFYLWDMVSPFIKRIRSR